MKRVALCSTIATIDSDSQALFGLPALSLMEHAALSLWSAVETKLGGVDSSLVFLCGGGNNGGDCLALARIAYNHGYRSIVCVMASAKLRPSCEVQAAIISKYGIRIIDASEQVDTELIQLIVKADVVFDGLAGTGLKGPLLGTSLRLVQEANQSNAFRIAVDIPSGISDEVSASAPHIQAHFCGTFGLRKLAMYHPATRASCGEIIVKNPSFPPQLLEKAPTIAQLYNNEDMSFPSLHASSYKNSRGHLGIVGGSKQYSGAARLSARAAFASRVGLVTLFCDEEVYPIAARESPSVIVRILNDEANLSSFDALLVGPGWGEGRSSILEEICSLHVPMVLDADGIAAYATLLQDGKDIEHGPLIMTPHLGELKRLYVALFDKPVSDIPRSFFDQMQRAADKLQATLVIKSSLVHIVSPGESKVAIIEGLNPSLGVAGSGDVLSGIIAALLAGGMQSSEAALQGSLLHQQGGAHAHASYGYYDSETLIASLGKVIAEEEV